MGMEYVGIIILFAAIFIFIYGFLYYISYEKIMISNRLLQIKNLNNSYMEENGTENHLFTGRLFREIYSSLCHFLMKATPGYKLDALTRKLEKAGILKHCSVQNWIYKEIMIMIISSALICMLTYAISRSAIKTLFMAIIFTILVKVCIRFYITKKIEIRRRNILKDLPYTLDLITVSVEAGTSFDGAMARVITNISGDICDEFAKCLKEIKMGIQRKIALRNMSERCEVPELTTFVNSLIQADELGVSLGRVLRIESANLREARKQRAREKAMKAPVKMLFPLIFFIFPSIFIIILGPSLIKIFSAFK